MAGARGAYLLDIIPKGTALEAALNLPAGVSPEFVRSPDGTTVIPTGNIVADRPSTSTGLIGGLLQFAQTFGGVLSAPFTGGSSLVGTGAKLLPVLAPQNESSQIIGRFTPMSFADGDSGFSLPSFGDLGQVLQGGLGQQLLGIGTQALSGYVQQQFAPQPVSFPMATQTMAAVPTIARAGAMVGRSFFNRFPNLATAIQGYLNRGIAVNRSKLWGLLKRFGPDFLVTGGILTAAAVAELTIAGPGRRRMNAGNVKALRRAHRRMKAFHNVCRTNDTLLTHRRGSKRASPFAARTQITQVK